MRENSYGQRAQDFVSLTALQLQAAVLLIMFGGGLFLAAHINRENRFDARAILLAAFWLKRFKRRGKFDACLVLWIVVSLMLFYLVFAMTP